jgi:hypothetical protein
MRRRPGWSARGGRDEAVHFRYDDGPLDGKAVAGCGWESPS